MPPGQFCSKHPISNRWCSMKPLVITLLASILLCGCAHRSEPPARVAVTATPIFPPQAQTVDWGHSGRAGAAERQPGWVHVLAENPLNHDLGQRDYRLTHETMRTGNSVPEKTTVNRGYSHYEMQRWERYCNRGKGMDRRDREFVSQENFQVPAAMRDHCQPPSRP